MLVTNSVLQVGVLGGKAGVAVVLLAAGGAKLADLRGFAASVRLFLPRAARGRLPVAVACGVAAGELAAGTASLALPLDGWLNLVVLAICVSFLMVAAAGYTWHRGRPCRCFGALSRRGFSAAGVLRAGGLALTGLVATVRVPLISVQLGAGAQAGLLAGAVLVAAAAFSAAAAGGKGLKADPLSRLV